MRTIFVFVLFMTALCSVAQESDLITWDLNSEAILKNDGNGNGVRVKLPINAIDLKSTIEFTVLSGEIKSISIYAKGYKKEDNKETWAKCFEAWEPIQAISPENMKSLNTWKKDNEWYTYEDFIITINGDPDRFNNEAAEVKLTYRKLTNEEKHTAAKTGSFILMLVLIGSIWYLYKFTKNKRADLILNRKETNSSINAFTIGMGLAAFIGTLIILFVGSFIVAILTNAPKGFNNDLGYLMIAIPIGALILVLRYMNDIRYNRCPTCHKYGDIIDLGSEYAGSETTTTYQDGNRVGQSTTKTYYDYRKCPECEHVWSVKRTSTSSWGRNA